MSDQTVSAPTTPRSTAGGEQRDVGGRAKARWVVSLLVLAAGAAAIGGFARHWWTVGRFLEETDDAYVGGDVTAVAPKVAGLIAQVHVVDNQPVHAGDLLVSLDDRDFRAALDRADAQVATRLAALDNLAANRRLQLSIVAEKRADLDATAAEFARSRDDTQRYQSLTGTGATTLQRAQQADADYKKALAADVRAHAAVQTAQRQLEVIDTQTRQAEAALAAARAERESAALNLGYCQVRAPIDGVVGNRSARAGAYVTVGAQLLAVVPARGLWVDANFKENQLAAMAPGQRVAIRADVLPGRIFQGHVATLAPATGAVFSVLPPENATGNFTKIVQRVPVRVVLEEGAATLGYLRPGLSVTAEVDTRPPSKAPGQDAKP